MSKEQKKKRKKVFLLLHKCCKEGGGNSFQWHVQVLVPKALRSVSHLKWGMVVWGRTETHLGAQKFISVAI